MNLLKLYKQYQFVFTELVKRDFKKKYKRSFLGAFYGAYHHFANHGPYYSWTITGR